RFQSRGNSVDDSSSVGTAGFQPPLPGLFSPLIRSRRLNAALLANRPSGTRAGEGTGPYVVRLARTPHPASDKNVRPARFLLLPIRLRRVSRSAHRRQRIRWLRRLLADATHLGK